MLMLLVGQAYGDYQALENDLKLSANRYGQFNKDWNGGKDINDNQRMNLLIWLLSSSIIPEDNEKIADLLLNGLSTIQDKDMLGKLFSRVKSMRNAPETSNYLISMTKKLRGKGFGTAEDVNYSFDFSNIKTILDAIKAFLVEPAEDKYKLNLKDNQEILYRFVSELPKKDGWGFTNQSKEEVAQESAKVFNDLLKQGAYTGKYSAYDNIADKIIFDSSGGYANSHKSFYEALYEKVLGNNIMPTEKGLLAQKSGYIKKIYEQFIEKQSSGKAGQQKPVEKPVQQDVGEEKIISDFYIQDEKKRLETFKNNFEHKNKYVDNDRLALKLLSGNQYFFPGTDFEILKIILNGPHYNLGMPLIGTIIQRAKFQWGWATDFLKDVITLLVDKDFDPNSFGVIDTYESKEAPIINILEYQGNKSSLVLAIMNILLDHKFDDKRKLNVDIPMLLPRFIRKLSEDQKFLEDGALIQESAAVFKKLIDRGAPLTKKGYSRYSLDESVIEDLVKYSKKATDLQIKFYSALCEVLIDNALGGLDYVNTTLDRITELLKLNKLDLSIKTEQTKGLLYKFIREIPNKSGFNSLDNYDINYKIADIFKGLLEHKAYSGADGESANISDAIINLNYLGGDKSKKESFYKALYKVALEQGVIPTAEARKSETAALKDIYNQVVGKKPESSEEKSIASTEAETKEQFEKLKRDIENLDSLQKYKELEDSYKALSKDINDDQANVLLKSVFESGKFTNKEKLQFIDSLGHVIDKKSGLVAAAVKGCISKHSKARDDLLPLLTELVDKAKIDPTIKIMYKGANENPLSLLILYAISNDRLEAIDVLDCINFLIKNKTKLGNSEQDATTNLRFYLIALRSRFADKKNQHMLDSALNTLRNLIDTNEVDLNQFAKEIALDSSRKPVDQDIFRILCQKGAKVDAGKIDLPVDLKDIYDKVYRDLIVTLVDFNTDLASLKQAIRL